MSAATFNPASIAAPAATAAVSAAAATGAISTAWIPIVGPAVAAVTLGIMALINRKSGQQKIATTQIVNDLEPMLRRNLEAYFEGPRTVSSQALALKNFDDAWAWLSSQAACGNPEYGNAGRACIADRTRGGAWDWFAYYRDPIAADPDVVEDPSLEETLAAELPSIGGIPASQWLIPAALIVLALSL